jgi:hypothetical protein
MVLKTLYGFDLSNSHILMRDVAQFGRALRSGRKGRRFKSCHPDQYGGIAQMGERLNGIQEASGSIPLISTITKHGKRLETLVSSLFSLQLLADHKQQYPGRSTFLQPSNNFQMLPNNELNKT